MSDNFMSINTDLSIICGLEESLILNHLYDWIAHYKNKSDFYEGYYWIYRSINHFSKVFPFFSKQKIHKLLKSLKDKDLIISCFCSKDSFDRTLSYRLTQKALNLFF